MTIKVNTLNPNCTGGETITDEKWSDTFGTDTDRLNQAFVKTTNTDSTRKQVATYPAEFIKTSGDITCLYQYSFSGEMKTFTHTFQIKVEGESHHSTMQCTAEFYSISLDCRKLKKTSTFHPLGSYEILILQQLSR